MEKVLKIFASRREHRTSDSTFLVFMSHGILNGICGVEHQEEKPDVLPHDSIFQIFNTLNCSHLKDKPKVIIVQACRGGEFPRCPEIKRACILQAEACTLSFIPRVSALGLT